MKNRFALPLIAAGIVFFLYVEAKKTDPYKVLGVDRNASNREIQKAFHKLSLQYHPDKNKNKGAQEKFAEINNAYDILSDEQKRKNYDLYGDEKGSPGFDAGDPGQHGGYSYFTNGGPGQSGFNFRPGGWQDMGGQEGSKSFSFSFGGPGSSGSGFDMGDIFSSFFGGGMGGGSQFGGFGSSGRSKQGTRQSTKSIASVNSQFYRKEIVDNGMTWLLLVHSSNTQEIQYYESVMEEVATTLQGALKVGSVNCGSETSLCKELGIYHPREPKIVLYSYASSEKASLVEYDGDLDVKSVKFFCQDHLPRFSKRIKLDKFDAASDAGRLPKVMLLSTKKSTPVIWRALSGLYHKHFLFYDVEVHDASDPSVRRLGIDSLPAIVGWLSNGDKEIIKTGISVKDLKSAIQELSRLLEQFEKKNKKASAGKDHSESVIPLLTASNFDDICGEKVPVCLIGVFKSTTTRDKLQKILQSVSQKSFSRRQKSAYGSRDPVLYALLDASKQQSFLTSLDKSRFVKSSDKLLLAYKRKRGTYAVSEGEITEEATESFISAVLNGDVQFSTAREKKPTLK